MFVKEFADELRLPLELLLEQLRAAGCQLSAANDLLKEDDKRRLLDYLRAKHKESLTQRRESERGNSGRVGDDRFRAGKSSQEIAKSNFERVKEKTCTECGTTYPATSDNFGHQPNGSLRGSCRKCMNKTSKKWRVRNPDGQAEFNANRVAREARAGIGYSDADVRRIRRELGDRCAYCNESQNGKGVIDHIIPICHGGAHSSDNITLACWKCNGDKHSKTPEEFLEWRKRAGLPIRKDIDWTKFRLPLTDDGVLELLFKLLAEDNESDYQLRSRIKDKLASLKVMLAQLLSRLKNDEKAVVEMRYGVNCPRVTTLWLIGDKLGLSQASVSGLQSSALKRLREMVKIGKIEGL